MSISLPPLPLDKVDALRIAQDDKLRQGLRTARTTRADDAARSRAYMQALQPTLEILFTDLALVRPKLPLHFVAATAQDLASQCEIVDDASRDEIQQFLADKQAQRPIKSSRNLAHVSVGISSAATTPGNGAQVADRIGLLRDSMQTALCSVDSPLSLEERAMCLQFFGLMERLATDADADRAAVAKSMAYAL